MKLKAAVLGAGAAFRKMLPGLRARFVLQSIYDPDTPVTTLKLLAPEEASKLVTSEQDLLRVASSCDVIFILSPPQEHARHLELASRLGIGVFVEKPPVIDADEVSNLELCVSRNPRIYFSDFYVDVRGAALLRAFGRRKASTAWLIEHLSPSAGAFGPDDTIHEIGKIETIQFKLLEGLGSAGDFDSRLWLREPHGGGVLLDLAFHGLMLYYALLAEPLTLIDYQLGIHLPGQKGDEYTPWTPSAGIAESYASLRFRSAAGPNFSLQAAKNWTDDLRNIVVKGSQGVASLDFGALGDTKNMLRIRPKDGLERTWTLDQDYWSLVAEGFYQYLESYDGRPHNYVESISAVTTLFNIFA
jgi:predicted dehydrogenase